MIASSEGIEYESWQIDLAACDTRKLQRQRDSRYKSRIDHVNKLHSNKSGSLVPTSRFHHIIETRSFKAASTPFEPIPSQPVHRQNARIARCLCLSPRSQFARAKGVLLFQMYMTCPRTISRPVVLTSQFQLCFVAMTAGTTMTTIRMMMPAIKQMRIFISFHHICFLTRLAPLLKP